MHGLIRPKRCNRLSTYHRSTRACAFEELQPQLQQALHDYAEQNELAGLQEQIVLCCQTISERIKTNRLAALLGEDRDLVFTLAVFLTPDWLVWARSGDHSKTTVVAARLKDIHVRPVASLLSNDHGLEIDGFVQGSFKKVHGSLLMGPEPAADEFTDAVDKAVKTANPPRRLLDLFGKTPD